MPNVENKIRSFVFFALCKEVAAKSGTTKERFGFLTDNSLSVLSP